MMKNRLLLGGFLSLTQFFVMSSAFATTFERRIELLEQALAPTTPKELAILYAKAIDDRNGAVQYMLLCPALQEKQRNLFEESNWITGTSSPSYSSFSLNQLSVNQFQIHFILTLQGKPAGTDLKEIDIRPVTPNSSSQHYCINSIR